jgi:hypothetical protein
VWCPRNWRLRRKERERIAGVEIRNEIGAARAREKSVLRAPVRVLPTPKINPLPSDPPVMPSAYEKVAQADLFDKSRNPTVVVEVPPPPPPKPVPPLPVYHGAMNLGGGLRVMLSVNKDSPQQAIRPGETIGQFKLVDVNTEEMTLEWEGQTIRKKVEELTAAPAPAEVAAARVEAPTGPTPPPPAVKSGPGDLTPQGGRVCAVNDGNAEGAVVEGYRKTIYTTPFGQSCLWQPVGK